MKYSIKPLIVKPEFTPFEITLTIENKREQEMLHDYFATKVSESGAFIRDVFLSGRQIVSASGVVPVRRPQ